MKVGDLVRWTYYCGIVTHIYKPMIGLVRVFYPFGVGEHDTVIDDLEVISEVK